MLSLLLDENISPEIVTQIAQKRPEIAAFSVHTWQEGRFMGQPDELILAEAMAAGLTLVTYDQKTIMPVLVQWGSAGTDHGGVIFVDSLSIAPNNFGALIRSLISLWDHSLVMPWANAVVYLKMEN